MRKALVITIFVLAITALSLSPALAQGDQATVNEVFEETEKIRRLEAPADVAVNYMSREELEDKLLEDMEEDMPEEETQIADDIMTMLDFIDEDLDLQSFYVDLLTEQIAGFYDPEDDSLYLISEDGEMDIMDEYTLSHELVHYLQDQNFDLERPPFEDPEDAVEETDDDAAFAATCLVEGDAVLASDIWLMEYADVTDMMTMTLDTSDYSFEVFESAPYYIQDSLLFPYTEGNEFVDYIHSEGGFAAVDAAYSNVPTSTEMIMHPEKYLEGEAVIQVDMPDITGDLGEGWELAYDNVLGEFDVYELFKPYLSSIGLRKASSGWGGNSYQYYRDSEGDKLLNQGYAWDSERDAQEFAAAYVRYMEDRFEDELEKNPDQGAWIVWTTDDYRFALKKDGINTFVIQATTDEGFDVTLGALGDEGDEIDLDAISSEEAVSSEEKEEERKKYYWVIVGGLLALLVIGLVLIFAMLLFYRRPPSPPTQPPGGPYMYPPYPPGGGPGTGYGGQGYGQQGYGGPPAGPYGGGQAPPPPPQA